MSITIYMLVFALLFVGAYAVIARKNVIKIIIGILIVDYAVNLLLVVVGYRTGGRPPILDSGESVQKLAASGVDPLPQAMVLTSIVIGLGLTALMVGMAIRLYEKYGTFDTEKMRRLKG